MAHILSKPWLTLTDDLHRELARLTTAMSRGNEEAWSEFHDLYFSRLHRYLIVLERGNEDRAADLLQLTLLRIVRHIRPFTEENTFWSWLTCLARCTAADEGRKRKRRFLFLEKFAHRQEFLREDQNSTIRDRSASLDQLLAKLPPDDRLLIEGKYFDRKSHQQLSQEHKLTPKAVESKLARLRLKLRQALENSPS